MKNSKAELKIEELKISANKQKEEIKIQLKRIKEQAEYQKELNHDLIKICTFIMNNETENKKEAKEICEKFVTK